MTRNLTNLDEDLDVRESRVFLFIEDLDGNVTDVDLWPREARALAWRLLQLAKKAEGG
jgi:hypothetical protein